jgi:hypothetical protein
MWIYLLVVITRVCVVCQQILAQCHTLVADGYLVADYEFLNMIFVFAAETAGL